MAVTISEGRGFPLDRGGTTANEIATGFVRVRTAGASELAERLGRLAEQFDASGAVGEKALRRAIKPALKLISDQYKSDVRDVTGNLGKSVKNKYVTYKNAMVGVVGPRSTGTGSASEKDGSGNHAWLIEFGTPPRRPGTQNRRTYINVHRMINGKMHRAGASTDSDFAKMNRGYYFLMGSLKEPTRQAKKGSGYPHDFATDSKAKGGMRPYTLGPGDTYGGVDAQHPMQKAIQAQGSNARQALMSSLQKQLKKFGG